MSLPFGTPQRASGPHRKPPARPSPLVPSSSSSSPAPPPPRPSSSPAPAPSETASKSSTSPVVRVSKPRKSESDRVQQLRGVFAASNLSCTGYLTKMYVCLVTLSVSTRCCGLRWARHHASCASVRAGLSPAGIDPSRILLLRSSLYATKCSGACPCSRLAVVVCGSCVVAFKNQEPGPTVVHSAICSPVCSYMYVCTAVSFGTLCWP